MGGIIDKCITFMSHSMIAIFSSDRCVGRGVHMMCVYIGGGDNGS